MQRGHCQNKLGTTNDDIVDDADVLLWRRQSESSPRVGSGAKRGRPCSKPPTKEVVRRRRKVISGPRCTRGPVYGSRCLQLTDWVTLLRRTWCNSGWWRYYSQSTSWWCHRAGGWLILIVKIVGWWFRWWWSSRLAGRCGWGGHQEGRQGGGGDAWGVGTGV